MTGMGNPRGRRAERSRPGRGRSRPGRRWWRTVRLAALLGLILGSAGALVGPAAQASQPGRALPAAPSRPVAQSALRGAWSQPAGRLRLWRPGGLRPDAWLPSVSGPVQAPASPWKVQPTPNPARQRNGLLVAVSCPGPASCLAVGSSYNRAGITVPLAERWDGTRWDIQAAPSPAGAIATRLFAVSCVSPSACTAVGYYYNRAGVILTLAERWNGTRWAIQATPSPPGALASGLFAVSCSSAAACTGVGESTLGPGQPVTLAERWNGTRWAIQAAPSPAGAQDSGLFAVSCSSATACTAAGASTSSSGGTSTLAEAWDGTRWAIQATPSPAGAASGFLGVSCTSPTACTAAGSYDTSAGSSASLAERWNGARWRLQAVPSPAGATGSEFTAVSCTSATACTAAGAYGGGSAGADPGGPAAVRHSGSGVTAPLAEAWNGARWAVQATPSPAGSTGAGFSGLACAAVRCTAVGSYARGISPVGVPLAEARSGTRWAVQATPSAVGASIHSELTAVSCSSPAACTAVGYYSQTANRTVTLAERWNGTRWRLQPTPNPAHATSASLYAVSCSSPRACTAAGYYDTTPGTALAFAESWNGQSWRVQVTPSPAGATSSALYGVSCTSPRACTAVGSYAKGTRPPASLAERWNGQSWRVQAVPAPAGAQVPRLSGVSCTGPRACTAVGNDANHAGQGQPLVAAWNGTRWAIQATPLPAGASGGVLSAVSCTSRSACTATGSLFASPGGTLADRWNGRTWRVQATPNPADFASSTSQVTLSGVSCASARDCVAIGNYTPGNRATAFAEAWNGTRWTLRPIAIPPDTSQSFLGGVSCARTRCTAAGAYTGLTGIVATLAMATSP